MKAKFSRVKLGIQFALSGALLLQATTAWAASCNAGGTDTQSQQYCNAAKAADEAAKQNMNAMIIHGAVTAVCTAACVGSWTGVSSIFCTVSSVAGGVADAVITKNYGNAMMSLASSGATLTAGSTMNSLANEAAKKLGGDGTFFGPQAQAPMPEQVAGPGMEGAEEGPQEVGIEGTDVGGSEASNAGETASSQGESASNDAGSCLTAAMEGFQTFMRGSDMKTQKDAADQNRAAAEKVATPGGSAIRMSQQSVLAAQSGSGQGSASIEGGGRASAPIMASNSSGPSADICNKGASGNFRAAIQCAVGSDKTIPKGVLDPRFERALMKATRMKPDNFAKKMGQDGLPSSVAAGAAASTGNGEFGQKMGALFASMEKQMHIPDVGGTYAGSGGGRKGGGEEGPGFDKIMGDLMAQFGPKKDDDKSPGVNRLKFGAEPQRFPASVVDDRKVSIFERVTARYYYVSGRVLSPLPAAPAQRVYK